MKEQSKEFLEYQEAEDNLTELRNKLRRAVFATQSKNLIMIFAEMLKAQLFRDELMHIQKREMLELMKQYEVAYNIKN